MVAVSGTPVRALASVLGFPPGAGELVDQPTRRRLVLSLAGSIVMAALDMLGVIAMLPLLQFVAGSDRDSGALGVIRGLAGEPSDETLVVIVAGLVVVAFVGKGLFALVFRRWQLHFMADQEARLATRMLASSLAAPYPVQVKVNTGDKVWLITGAVSIGYTTSLFSALSALTEIFTIVFILVAMTFVSAPVTLAALAYIGIAAVVLGRFVRPRIAAAGLHNREASEQASELALQALGSAKEIKLRSAGDLFVSRFGAARQRGAGANAGAMFLSEVPKYFIEMLFVLGIGILAISITSQGTSPDNLILLGVFAAAGGRIMPSAVRLLSAVNMVRYARESLRVLVEERRRLVDAADQERARIVTSEVPQGDIELSGVSFAYDGTDRPVIDDLSLLIRDRTSIALVGTSGAGKSTLVDLLLGLLGPTTGRITAGGLDIHDNLPAWQSQLAVVPQDVILFDGSLRANIAFDLPFDEELFADVVRRAQLSDLVAQLPDGLDSIVGERGSRLSGGQQQRLGIARALYRRPRLLVLDEATSALDNDTEHRLNQTMDALRHEMTIVVVAHRLSSVRRCDEVIYLSEGRIGTRGTFEEVVATNAEFAHLVRLGSLDG